MALGNSTALRVHSAAFPARRGRRRPASARCHRAARWPSTSLRHPD